MRRRTGKTKGAIRLALVENGRLTLSALLAECPQIPSRNAAQCCLRELRRQGLVTADTLHGHTRVYSLKETSDARHKE